MDYNVNTLQPNDVILVRIDANKINLDEAEDFHARMKKKFPNNVIITIPEGVDIDFMIWERVYRYLMSIKPKGEEENDTR